MAADEDDEFRSFRCDFADRGAVYALIERLPPIDILVLNAGTIERKPAAEHGDDIWDRVLEVNLTAPFVLARELGLPMIERGSGKIVFVASLLAFQGGITVPGYAASKGGIAQLTKALANEWAAKGVNVNAIAPGYIATDNTDALRNDEARSRQILERIPAGRWGIPDDLAGAFVFLASPASDYVQRRRAAGRRRMARTVNGRVVPVLTAESADDAERACEAILAGGMTSVEITLRTEAAVEAIRRASRIEGLLVGAGTVLTGAQLAAAVDAGAQFAVAPSTNESVVRAAQAAGIEVVPGAATPTEIDRARALGCGIVKLFPASLRRRPGVHQGGVGGLSGRQLRPDRRRQPGQPRRVPRAPLRARLRGHVDLRAGSLREGRFDEIERRARDAAALVPA